MNSILNEFPIDPKILFAHELSLENLWGFDYLKLIDCSVLVLGVGGFGTHVAMGLARMGLREIILVDHDVVNFSNIPRHILYSTNDIGRPKIEAALFSLQGHNIRSRIEGNAFDVVQDRHRLAKLIKKADFIFTLFDSRGPTILTSWLCHYYRKPMVSGGVDSTAGFTFMYRYQSPEAQPCEECYARSAVLAPISWTNHYLSLINTSPTPSEVVEFDFRSSASSSSPIIYTSACMGSQQMLNVFIRNRIGKVQPTQVRFNAMDHQVLISRELGRLDCKVCGKSAILINQCI